MQIARYDYQLRRRIPHDVPDTPIQDFIHFLCETDNWRTQPAELMVERCLKLRKTLVSEAKPVAEEPDDVEVDA